MRKNPGIVWVLFACFIALLTRHAAAADYVPEAGSDTEKNAASIWAVTPDERLPNVLILGDSISIGYTLQVRNLLKGKANVFRPHSPDGKQPVNCQGTKFSIDHLDGWLAGRKWDVIHFNFGLHDLKHVDAKTGINSSKASDPRQASVEKYAENLELIITKLKATGARLIFATTTPVPPGVNHPLREPDAPVRYNEAALKLIKAHALEVNDLYTSCEKRLKELQLPRNVHFNPQGNRVLAEQVTRAIRRKL